MKLLIDEEVVKQALDALEDVDLVQYDKEVDDYYLDCCKSRAPIHSKLSHSGDCQYIAAITALRSAIDAAEKVED